jgi:hypothetical protein
VTLLASSQPSIVLPEIVGQPIMLTHVVFTPPEVELVEQPATRQAPEKSALPILFHMTYLPIVRH